MRLWITLYVGGLILIGFVMVSESSSTIHTACRQLEAQVSQFQALANN